MCVDTYMIHICMYTCTSTGIALSSRAGSLTQVYSVYVCVCERESARAGERERESESDSEREGVCAWGSAISANVTVSCAYNQYVCIMYIHRE